MKRILVVMLLVAFASIGAATRQAAAQEQSKEKAASSDKRWSGGIQQMDKDNLTLTVRHRDGRTRVVHYTASTKWADKAGKAVDLATVKVEDRVVCVGEFEGDKFVAVEVILQR